LIRGPVKNIAQRFGVKPQAYLSTPIEAPPKSNKKLWLRIGLGTLVALVQIDFAATNDAPIFNLANTIIDAEEDAVFTATAAIAIGISTGGGSDEINQTLSFTVTPKIPELFEGTPTLTSTGMLDIHFKQNASGNSKLSVVLCNNEGSAITFRFIESSNTLNNGSMRMNDKPC